MAHTDTIKMQMTHEKLVFPDKYIATLSERSTPPKEIATSQGYCTVREQVERWVALLPDDCQKNVIAKLRKGNKQTWDTYHELAVGHVLRMSGFTPLYEERRVKKSPVDWYVPHHNPPFLVEVFSASYDGDNDIDVSVENRLCKLLNKIDVLRGAEVCVWLDKSVTWTETRLAQVADTVKNSLSNRQCSVGQTCWEDDFSFRVESLGENQKVKIVVSPMATLVKPKRRLSDGIEEKVNKYKSAKLPLVIAVVTDPILAAGKAFDNVLNGSWCYHSETRISTRSNDDGLFRKLPDLSAVLHLQRNWGWGEWSFTEVFYNPIASLPLAPDTFPVTTHQAT